MSTPANTDGEPTAVIPPLPAKPPPKPSPVDLREQAKKAAKKTAKKEAKPAGVTELAPDEVGETVMSKSGRPLVAVHVGDLPPPPPQQPIGRVIRKSDIAAAYYHKCGEPDGKPFAQLGLNAQSQWLERALNAGGSK